MKKFIGILSLILILTSATIVSANPGDNINFSVALTSGNYSYSEAIANKTGVASIAMSKIGLTSVQCSTYSTVTLIRTASYPLSSYQNHTWRYVNAYGGEPVKAAFFKKDINGIYNITGLYYYDGGIS